MLCPGGCSCSSGSIEYLLAPLLLLLLLLRGLVLRGVGVRVQPLHTFCTTVRRVPLLLHCCARTTCTRWEGLGCVHGAGVGQFLLPLLRWLMFLVVCPCLLRRPRALLVQPCGYLPSRQVAGAAAIKLR